jgi:hypothetical protein
MMQRTHVTGRLYFGMDPVHLRTAMARTFMRVTGLPPERARVTTAQLCQDFALDAVEGAALIDEFVAKGLLDPPADDRKNYGLTPEFVALALARIVAPLARERAQKLLADVSTLAEQLNETAISNPLRIEKVVVFGEYLNNSDHLAELGLGLLVGARPPSLWTRFGRMQTKAEGAEAIQAAFQELSSFIRVQLSVKRESLPRPFTAVYEMRRNKRSRAEYQEDNTTGRFA